MFIMLPQLDDKLLKDLIISASLQNVDNCPKQGDGYMWVYSILSTFVYLKIPLKAGLADLANKKCRMPS